MAPFRKYQLGIQIRRSVPELGRDCIMATFIDAAETKYPKTYHGGNEIILLEGATMLPILTNTNTELHEYIFGEHFDNCVVWWKN